MMEIKDVMNNAIHFVVKKTDELTKIKEELPQLKEDIGTDKDIIGLESKLKEMVSEISLLRDINQNLEEEKEQLEEYNKHIFIFYFFRKANEEIRILIETLKKEQEKQRQVSGDLEALTSELKSHRISQNGAMEYYLP